MPPRSVSNHGVAPYDSIRPDHDAVQLRAERLQKVRNMMAKQQFDAVLLLDPYKQRNATARATCLGISCSTPRATSTFR